MKELSAVKDGKINSKKSVVPREFGRPIYAGYLATLVLAQDPPIPTLNPTFVPYRLTSVT